MIKKILHYVCFIIASVLWIALLAFILRLLILLAFGIDPYSAATYVGLSAYWNSGGVLAGKDILMFVTGLLFFPLCLYGFRKLYKYQYSVILIHNYN